MIKKYKYQIVFHLFLTILFCAPYLFTNSLPIEHDTFFHLARIEHYAIAIKNMDLLPGIYPYANGGFGYGTPLFYSDILLFLPSLLHALGLPLIITYKLFIFVLTLLSSVFIYYLLIRTTKNNYIAALSSIVYLFNNYHIADVYVRNALGEVMALTFLPLFLLGLYTLFYEKDEKSWPILFISLSLIVLSHNITFLFVVVLFIIFFAISLFSLNKEIIKKALLAVTLAFLCTIFFTLPMIEQLSSQSLMIDYYKNNSTLHNHSMALWQYFENKTIFGYSGNHLEKDRTMVVNVGYFLTFFPLLYLFINKEDKTKFFNTLFILGYIFLILPSSFIPWDKLTFLSTIQFPWRLNTITTLLLTPVSAYATYKLLSKNSIVIIASCILLLEGIFHIYPVFNRTFVLPNNTSWQEVQNGSFVDPYYSADYMRVELAGSEYLPSNHVDFRDYPFAIRDKNNEIVDASLRQNYTTLEILFPTNTSGNYTIPLTYYKGYQVYDSKNNKLDTYRTNNGFVAFVANKDNSYICKYENTTLRSICIVGSLISILFSIYLIKKS